MPWSKIGGEPVRTRPTSQLSRDSKRSMPKSKVVKQNK